MRLLIVAELAEDGGERSCNSFDLPIVKSTCTHHFKVLREVGRDPPARVGTKRVNLLRSQDLEARFPGLLAAVLGGDRQRVGGAALAGALVLPPGGRDRGRAVATRPGVCVAPGASSTAAAVPADSRSSVSFGAARSAAAEVPTNSSRSSSR